MNKQAAYLILILLSLLRPQLILAQNIAGADIKFEKLVYDYGNIYQNDNGLAIFKFTNVGNEPLILTNVIATCGCTVPSWPKEPLLPGETNIIQVKYDTKRIGQINKNITVVSNALNSQINLIIKGNVLKKPDEIMPFKHVNSSSMPIAQ